MSKQKITTILFGLALFTFIAISVPHLAWVFHSYEADATGGWMDYAWWGLSYAEALGIDVLIFWLTVVQTTEYRAKAGVIWGFTLLLCLWSWYCNYLYTIDHAPHGTMWNIPLFGTPLTAGVLTPYLVSAIPLFILCYKFIHSLLENGTPESMEQLAARVADMQQRKGYEQQLAELQSGKFTGLLKKGIAGSVDVARFAVNTVNTSRGTAEPLPVNSEQEPVNTEQETEPLSVNREQPDVNSEQETEHPEVNSEPLAIHTEPIPIHREQRKVNSGIGKREQIKQLLAANPRISLTQIVDQTGISRTRASVLRNEILREA